MALSIWGAGLWALFVVSAFKLPHYALPAYPAVALLAARWWIEDPPRVAGPPSCISRSSLPSRWCSRSSPRVTAAPS
jgi:hypothetical protein